MPSPPLEVADIFRAVGPGYRTQNRLSRQQLRTMRAIEICRTSTLGGHVKKCDQCGHIAISYNSCRNRHCPKCQSLARAKWLQQRQAELLPVPYFHVVFTVPEQIAALALQNKRVIYNILFQAVSQTLLKIAGDSKHLGARIGVLAVLHTWGQQLLHHPHIHCVVTGGGLAGSHWISTKTKQFFLPVPVLRKMFRGKFLALLQEAFADGTLKFHNSLSVLNDAHAFHDYLKPLYHLNWVVYCKAPFGGPSQVLQYLGRYTHRVAISNHRLLAFEHGKVSFGYKDYRDPLATKVMTLDASEFIRRFLIHVLPSHFVRIRHYGFLANASRKTSLILCRTLLNQTAADPPPQQDWRDLYQSVTGNSFDLCPQCKVGHLIQIEILLPSPQTIDSS